MTFIKKIPGFIPGYARKPLLFLLALNMAAYCLPSFLPVEPRFDFSLPIDGKIPSIPVFSYIYVIAYVYWVFNYILISSRSKAICFRFVCAEAAGKAICFLMFVFLPSTFARPAADTLSGPGAWLNRLIFMLDEPTRLIPSIHCYASWMCVRPLLGKSGEGICTAYKVFSMILTLLICLSTLFTRQHVVADVFAGLLLAEAVWLASGKLVPGKLIKDKKEVSDR